MGQDDPPITQEQALAFQTLVGAAENGTLLDELNTSVRDLVQTMYEHQTARGGKPKGSLSLSFSFTMDQHGLMEVVADVNVKEPKAARSRSIMYRTAGNSLSPNNPKQTTMDLGAPREVPAAPMRVVV